MKKKNAKNDKIANVRKRKEPTRIVLGSIMARWEEDDTNPVYNVAPKCLPPRFYSIKVTTEGDNKTLINFRSETYTVLPIKSVDVVIKSAATLSYTIRPYKNINGSWVATEGIRQYGTTYKRRFHWPMALKQIRDRRYSRQVTKSDAWVAVEIIYEKELNMTVEFTVTALDKLATMEYWPIAQTNSGLMAPIVYSGAYPRLGGTGSSSGSGGPMFTEQKYDTTTVVSMATSATTTTITTQQ